MGRVISRETSAEPDAADVYPVPAGVGEAGAALWREVAGSVGSDWALYAKDLANLLLAAKTADTIAVLEAALAKDVEQDELMVSGSTGQDRLNPIVAELRAQRAAQASLLKLVELEPPTIKTGRMNRRQRDRLMDERAGLRPVTSLSQQPTRTNFKIHRAVDFPPEPPVPLRMDDPRKRRRD